MSILLNVKHPFGKLGEQGKFQEEILKKYIEYLTDFLSMKLLTHVN